MSRRIVLALGLAGSVMADAANAQSFSFGPSSRRIGPWTFDVGAQMAQPVGDFSGQIDRAWGMGGSIRHHLRGRVPLGIRADFGWLNYGNERKRVPLTSTLNRVLVDMNTSNNIAAVTLGPELMLMRGPIRPYAHAFAGFSYFYTQS